MSYAVVGYSECSMLWVVEGRPETSQCPRCGTRRQYAKRRKFLTTDDEDHAREMRASMLANRQEQGDAFAELDSFADMEERVDDAGPDDDAYLEASGIDPDAVAEAGERAMASRSGGSTSRDEVVRAALRELDDPTEDDVVAYATERDVSEAFVETALRKLVRAGEVTESRGVYRLV
jgi:Arc/MetJ-type ribon-helix-helix transcriptional regulator